MLQQSLSYLAVIFLLLNDMPVVNLIKAELHILPSLEYASALSSFTFVSFTIAYSFSVFFTNSSSLQFTVQVPNSLKTQLDLLSFKRFSDCPQNHVSCFLLTLSFQT